MGQSLLQKYIELAQEGTRASVDEIMAHLNMGMSIAESKIIDFALGNVDSEEGRQAMEHYLFHGTQIQRNYCTLYFIRREEYRLVRQAYELGLIDYLQAFTR